jgi:hypothetical protein
MVIQQEENGYLTILNKIVDTIAGSDELTGRGRMHHRVVELLRQREIQREQDFITYSKELSKFGEFGKEFFMRELKKQTTLTSKQIRDRVIHFFGEPQVKKGAIVEFIGEPVSIDIARERKVFLKEVLKKLPFGFIYVPKLPIL